MTLEESLNALPGDGSTAAEKMRQALAMYDEGVARARRRVKLAEALTGLVGASPT